MYRRNGTSELAKLMFKNSGDAEKLKQLLTDNYSEDNLVTYLHSKDPTTRTCCGFRTSAHRHVKSDSCVGGGTEKQRSRHTL